MTFFDQIGAVEEKVWTAVTVDGDYGISVFVNRSEEGLFREIRATYGDFYELDDIADEDLAEFFEDQHNIVLSIERLVVED